MRLSEMHMCSRSCRYILYSLKTETRIYLFTYLFINYYFLLLLLLFYFGHQTLYGVFQPDSARPDAARHTTQFLANNNDVQIFPGCPCLHVHQSNTFRTSWTEMVEVQWTPCKRVWVVPGTQEGVSSHSSASDSTPDPICEMLSGCWFSRRTSPTDLRVARSKNTDWLNFLLDEKSVKIMNFDLNQLQNEIWWTWFLLLNFRTFERKISKQVKYAFFFLME